MTASKNHGNLLCARSQPACVPHAVLPDVDNQTPDNGRWYCPTRLPKQRARSGGFGPRTQTAFSTQCTNLQSRTRRQHPAAHDRDELVKDESFHCQRELGTIVPRLCDSVVPVDTGILPKQGYDEPSAPSGHTDKRIYGHADKCTYVQTDRLTWSRHSRPELTKPSS